MKNFFKILIPIILITFLSGCSLNTKGYNKELFSIFPEEKTSLSYYGLAEYGHNVTINEVKKERTKVTYYVDGYLNDAKSSDNKDRNFSIKYTIDFEKVTEKITNEDKYRKNDSTLNSVIPNNIILKAPLKVGNKWTQKFTYKGKEYVSTTEITKILELKENKKHYITETRVKNIKDFFDDEYFESRTFETGKGMTSFMNTMEEYDIDVDRELTKEDFIFGYTQVSLEE